MRPHFPDGTRFRARTCRAATRTDAAILEPSSAATRAVGGRRAAPRRRAVLRHLAALVLLATPTAQASGACLWREPPRVFPPGEVWNCAALRWADGDTLTVTCAEQAEPVRIRLRGVDTAERGTPDWHAARAELRRRTEAAPLIVMPHHHSGRRVVADVLSGGVNIGLAMDAAGWSKETCPRR